MTHPTPYLMSIEPVDGQTFRHGFHLGTDLTVARACCVDRFRGRNACDLEHDERGRPMATRTVALLDARGRIVDVYDGQWSSERVY